MKSRAILSLGYDVEERTLEVEFHSGRVYQYFDLDRSLYEWLLRSNDKGGLLKRLVIGHHREEEVTIEAEPVDLIALLRASIVEPGPDEDD